MVLIIQITKISDPKTSIETGKSVTVKESTAFAAFLDNQQKPAIKRSKVKSKQDVVPKNVEESSNSISNIVSSDNSLNPSVQKHSQSSAGSLIDVIEKYTNFSKEKFQESEKKVLSLQQYKEVKKNSKPKEDVLEDPFETEIKMALRKAITNLERMGFFSEGKIERSSTEMKFFSYFMRKFKNSPLTSERRKSEIEQTLRLYAGRIRDKINKTK